MGKVTLAGIVKLPAFEEAGALFHRATGMALSFYNEQGEVIFYPSVERCHFCQIIQSSPRGMKRCQDSDREAAESALKTGKPCAYCCHAGLIDVVVPVVVGSKRIGCFYSGQSLTSSPTPEAFEQICKMVQDLDVDTEELYSAYKQIHIVDESNLEVAIGLLTVICNHLVESEMALQQERQLTLEQRRQRKSAEEKARLEKDLREMELRLVQAQLNPHFLFNVLNLILGHAMAENATKTRKLVEDLSVLLRSSLSQIGSKVTLAEEAANAAAFVDIHRFRFRSQIEVRMDISKDLETLLVPALILQPLVENALVHGMPDNREMNISISAEPSDNNVLIRVSDNGRGIKNSELENIRYTLSLNNHAGKTTGLAGLVRRLNYYYKNAELTIYSEGESTIVEITIPSNP